MAEVPAGSKLENISDFSGGLYTSYPSWKIPSNYSPYMRNVLIDNGQVERINGYETLGSTFGTHSLNKVTGIFPYVQEDGTTKFLVTDSSVTLETANFSNWVFVSSGDTTSTLLNWMQVRNKMWGFNGVDATRTWDGTSKVILDGTKGNPNVPKFRFGAYYHERVWGLNDSAGGSRLNYSAISSTRGELIAPDSYLAWPSANFIQVGQGDGQTGTALWVGDSLLQAGKQRSIYTVYGKDEASYFARREEKLGDGVASNETVVNLDGTTYWLGQDAVYADGVRITDNIQDEVDSIEKPSTNLVQNLWEIQGDFENGQFANSTTTVSGLVQLHFGDKNLAAADASIEVWKEFDNVTTFTPVAYFTSTTSLPSNGVYQFKIIRYFAQKITAAQGGTDCGDTTSPGKDPQLNYIFTNARTSETISFTIGDPTASNTGLFSPLSFNNYIYLDGSGNPTSPPAFIHDYQNSLLQMAGNRITFTGDDFNTGKLGVKIVLLNHSSGTCVRVGNPTESVSAEYTVAPSTVGQFISEVTTLTSVTAWGQFDSVNNTNGGKIDYFIRASTALVTLTTQTWSPISPGSIIGVPVAQRFIQWASTISVSTNSNASIDNVEINHIEGDGSLNRAFAIGWEGRYLLFGSTGAGDTLSYSLWKSIITNKNPHAWMPVEGINIRSLAKHEGILYGGSSSTGTVYRLDYGTNFDGSPIPSIYDTPDMVLGEPKNIYFQKDILKYVLDAEKDSGLTMNIGTSIDRGDFSTITRSLDGSGRYLREILGVVAPCSTLRVRLSNSQIDKKFNVFNFGVLYKDTERIRQ